ncbi:MAG: DUF2267 domain-containing protein [Nitrospirota bacterium]
MEYDAFIKLIQESGQIDRFGVAERAASAVLEVLGEHLTEARAIGLARELPTHIRDAVMQNNTAQSFDLTEFIQRVVDREEITFPEAENHVRTVLSVLPELVSPETLQGVAGQLPGELRALLGPERKAAASAKGP